MVHLSRPEHGLGRYFVLSLGTLYDYTPITHSSAGRSFTYIRHSEDCDPDLPTPTITLSTPETQAEHWSLHASSIWVSSLYIADHISELGLPTSTPLRLIELGAGAGLPSILIAKSYPHAQVIASDFPDPLLIHTLRENVARNDASANCSVVPHAWGTDPSALLPTADVVLAADTLWNSELHAALLRTTCAVLARTPDARAHFVASMHTGRYTLESFLRAAGEAGLELVEVTERKTKGEGRRREWDVRRGESEDEDERERRRWVV
jgi:nicotinamide N-methyltransferase